MFKCDLLHVSSDHLYKKPNITDDSVIDDLKIRRFTEFCSGFGDLSLSKDCLDYAVEVLKSPCSAVGDLLYRQQIFAQLKQYDLLAERLYSALSEVLKLVKIRESYSFSLGDESDVAYLRTVNYIYFIKNHINFVASLYAILEPCDFKHGEGLYLLKEKIIEQQKYYASEGLLEPIEYVLSFFKDKRDISGEFVMNGGFFTDFNYDSDKSRIVSSLPEKIPFPELIKNLEMNLGIYKDEYSTGELILSSTPHAVCMPEFFSGFEKKFLLSFMYNAEKYENADFLMPSSKIAEIHDAIDLGDYVNVFTQMKFYRTMIRAIKIMDSFLPYPSIFPEISDSSFELNLRGVSDPILAVQKLIDYRNRKNTNNLPTEKFTDIVPNDIDFKNKTSYVVTGPNNGGKTSFIRAISIAVIFFSAGMPVAADSARISAGVNIFTHFTADETHKAQSGRLQYEVERLNSITRQSGKNSLIILNETFAGTNSVKALDLFEDFLRQSESRGFKFIYVTHFHNIAFSVEENQQDNGEKFALYEKTDNLIAVLDDVSLRRTYRLLPKKPSDTSYSQDIVEKHNLTWTQISHKLGFLSVRAENFEEG